MCNTLYTPGDPGRMRSPCHSRFARLAIRWRASGVHKEAPKEQHQSRKYQADTSDHRDADAAEEFAHNLCDARFRLAPACRQVLHDRQACDVGECCPQGHVVEIALHGHAAFAIVARDLARPGLKKRSATLRWEAGRERPPLRAMKCLNTLEIVSRWQALTVRASALHVCVIAQQQRRDAPLQGPHGQPNEIGRAGPG